jgi:DNA modification methylase
MFSTHNIDNLSFETKEEFDIIYCDYIYESLDFHWAEKYFQYLKEDGVFIAQTDWHSEHRLRVFMEDVLGAKFVNHLVWKCEWGNHPKDRFHQCYDDILIYSNSKNWEFHPEKIQVPKATITSGLNPSGRTTKQATAWIDDITLTTTALERVKKEDGHLVKWQKPLNLYSRIIEPFYDLHAKILDPFMGSGSLGKYCMINELEYVGIESDYETYKLALKNIGDIKD